MSETQEAVWICNISDLEWIIPRTYGPMHILPCPKSQSYAMTKILPRVDNMDIGEGRVIKFPFSAADIARDIVQDLGVHGVFVCAGSRPTIDELAKAAQLRDDFYRKEVREGDGIWAKYHDYKMITDVQRRAALHLGLEREWAFETIKNVPCEFCGEAVRQGVAVCKSCGGILDREKALKGGLISREQYDGLTAEPGVAGKPRPARKGSPVGA